MGNLDRVSTATFLKALEIKMPEVKKAPPTLDNIFMIFKDLDADVKDYTLLKVLPKVRYEPVLGEIQIESHLGWTKIADLRGWGFLTGCGGGLCLPHEQAEEIQHSWGRTIVDALNANIKQPTKQKELSHG